MSEGINATYIIENEKLKFRIAQLKEQLQHVTEERDKYKRERDLLLESIDINPDDIAEVKEIEGGGD